MLLFVVVALFARVRVRGTRSPLIKSWKWASSLNRPLEGTGTWVDEINRGTSLAPRSKPKVNPKSTLAEMFSFPFRLALPSGPKSWLNVKLTGSSA